MELFTGDTGRPRVRRPTDSLALVSGLVALAVLCEVAVPLSALEQAVVDLVQAIGGWLDPLWRVVEVLAAVWAAAIVVATLVRGRGAALRDVVAGLAIAAALALGVSRVVTGDWVGGVVVDPMPGDVPFPPLLLAFAFVVLTTVGPSLTRPFRRMGHWLVAAAGVGAVLARDATPTGVLLAWVVAAIAAAAVRLLLGTDAGTPAVGSVRRSLASLGVDVASLEPARRQAAGVFTLDAVDPDGRRLLVKVYGRDAWDTQLVAKLWRALSYREAEALTLTRVQQVVHEAYVTLLLHARGVPVPTVVAAGRAANHDAVLVLAGRGTPLADRGALPVGGGEAPDDGGGTGATDNGDGDTGDVGTADAGLSEADLDDMWRLLASMHDTGLASGDVSLSLFCRDDAGSLAFSDIGTSVTTPSPDDCRIDQAQLLVLGAEVGGQDRSIAAARRALGDDGLAELLAYIQPAAMGPSMRAGVLGRGKKRVVALREATATALGAEAPEIAKLRRVSAGTLLQLALIALVAYSLISLVGNIDPAELAEAFSGADWAWIVAGLVVAQIAIASQAVTTQGASPRRVPYGPLVALQFAISFIMLAVPSTAARIAMVVRFFQQRGVPASAAVSISVIDSFTGFLVQVAVLLLTLGAGLGGVQLDFSIDLSGAGRDLLVLLAAAAAVVVVLAVLALVLRRVRRRIVERVRPWLTDVTTTMKAVRTPGRLMRIFGGNTTEQLLYGVTLALCVQAFGERVSLAEALVVWVLAALFGGFMPVPGGVGVVEAALAAGLAAVGIPEVPALGAAIAFRAVTFYLPPVWGWFAMHRLQRHGDL